MSAGRILLALGMALVAMLALPAFAGAATVEVVDTNGKKSVVDLDALAGQEDVVGTGYAIRSSSGTRTKEVTGFSLDMIIDQSEADRISYGFAEVSGGGRFAQLTNGQIRQSGAFPDGPPVVYAAGTNIGFIRPSLNSTDVNSTESFEVGRLTIFLRKGTPFTIDISASDTEVEVGDEIDFTSSVEAPKSISPTISWAFGDNRSASGASASHVFKEKGTYKVVASATTPEYPAGAFSEPVTIQVGEKKKKGPDRSGGGKNDDEDAPDSGSSEGTGGSDGTTSPYPSSPGTPAPVAPPTAAPPIPDQPKPDKPEPDPINGEEVRGELLQDAVVVPPPEPESKTDEAEPPSLRSGSEQGDGFGIPGAALGGMSVVALLGLGAAGQAGRIRPDAILWHANRLIGR